MTWRLTSRPDGRWQAVALDLVSLATSEDGYDAVVVFTDMFTKQIFCAPVRSKGTTAETIDELFVFHVNTTRKVCPRFCCHGMLSSLQFFLFELLGTWLKFSASYHHQTNGQVERMNKTLEETLRIFVQGKEAPAGRGRKQLTMFEFVLYGEVQHTRHL